MNDFDYDNLQKKRIAQGASHRKGGSKSKKCTMPSDLLTEAQRRKLNGPVTSVRLNQPMDWATFKGLSDQLKKIYIQNLRDMYNANAKMLASMFGVRDTTVSNVMKSLGFAPGKRGGANNSDGYQRKMAMWNAFCNGVVGGGDNNVPTKNESVEEASTGPTVWDITSEMLEGVKQPVILDPLEEPTPVKENTTPRPEPEPDEELADALLEALNKACEPASCTMSKLATTMTGSADGVLSNIRDLLALFTGKVSVKMSIEVIGGDAE